MQRARDDPRRLYNLPREDDAGIVGNDLKTGNMKDLRGIRCLLHLARCAWCHLCIRPTRCLQYFGFAWSCHIFWIIIVFACPASHPRSEVSRRAAHFSPLRIERCNRN